MVITLSSLKGGVGKSSLAMLIANNLAARGFKVLFWDQDTNNSSTGYYTKNIPGIKETVISKNVYEALFSKSVEGNIIPTRIENVDIVPSSLDLAKIRTLGFNTLKQTLQTANNYDYIIIDTAPTYDNLLINALTVSDLILTPLDFDEYNITTTHSLKGYMFDDLPEKIENKNWYLVYTFWKAKLANFETSLQSQLVNIFEHEFDNIISDIHIPDSSAMDKYILTDEKLKTTSSITGNKRLADEINKLVSMITGIDSPAEKF